jgi:hypothetical protein
MKMNKKEKNTYSQTILLSKPSSPLRESLKNRRSFNCAITTKNSVFDSVVAL